MTSRYKLNIDVRLIGPIVLGGSTGFVLPCSHRWLATLPVLTPVRDPSNSSFADLLLAVIAECPVSADMMTGGRQGLVTTIRGHCWVVRYPTLLLTSHLLRLKETNQARVGRRPIFWPRPTQFARGPLSQRLLHKGQRCGINANSKACLGKWSKFNVASMLTRLILIARLNVNQGV